MLDHARQADSLGFEGFWLAEHHFRRLGTVPNPAVMLAAIAMQTSRLRIGPAVSVLPYRSPELVAEDYALVDVLSGGRLNMGVGCGSQPTEYAGFGIDFESRWDVFRRNLIVLRELWSGTTLNVVPCQQPMPPIYVATSNEKNARTAGRTGDSIITLLSPAAADLSDMARLLDAHSEGLREAGYSENDAEVIVAQFAHVATSDEKARQHAVPALSHFLSLLSLDSSEVESVYESMQRRATGCFGSPAQAQTSISQLKKEGVKHVAFITRFGNMSATAAQRSLQLLAPASEKAHLADASHQDGLHRTTGITWQTQ